MPTVPLIEEYVQALDRRLTGPRRVRRDMVAEARDSLVDATEAYQAIGLEPRHAQARAVAEFGALGAIAVGYQMELVATVGRRLALLVAVFPTLAMLFGDRMWMNSPWSDGGGARPGADYLFLARSLDWMTYLLSAMAVLAFLALRRQARRGGDPGRLCRVLAVGTLATMATTTTLGTAIYVSTVVIWPAARTWPPMIIGGAVLATAAAAQVAAGVQCLRIARAAGDLTPALVAPGHQGTC